MRTTGLLTRAPDATPSDHACWGYGSDDERAQKVTAWLQAGLDLGQRALYVADASPEALLAELAGLPERDELVAAGALVVLPSREVYDLSRLIDPEEQLALYAGAVDAAIADGFQGIRVAADISVLVADSARRESHLHWEQFADRYIATQPLAPLCLYDTRTIRGIDPIFCIHPLQGPDVAPFTVYGTDTASAAVAGEVDTFGADTFGAILAALPVTDRSLDVGGLSFIDGHTAWLLHTELVRRRDAGQAITLTGVSRLVQRVWEACRFDPSMLEVA